MPQLNLNFTDLPIQETCLWDQLDDQRKQVVVETLSRLLLQATRAAKYQEPTHD